MLSFHDTHGSRGGTHNERLGGHNILAVAHPAQQLAVGNTGCSEEAVIAGDQIVSCEDAVKIVPRSERLLTLGIVSGC